MLNFYFILVGTNFRQISTQLPNLLKIPKLVSLIVQKKLMKKNCPKTLLIIFNLYEYFVGHGIKIICF